MSDGRWRRRARRRQQGATRQAPCSRTEPLEPAIRVGSYRGETVSLTLPAPSARSAISEAREANPALLDFEREIVARGRFTHLWALGHAGWWEPICRALDDLEPRVLEVGSFEGLSASYLLWRLPKAHVTCVDTFDGSLEHEGTDTVPAELELVFEENVALVDAARVRKLVGRSSVVLRGSPPRTRDSTSFTSTARTSGSTCS